MVCKLAQLQLIMHGGDIEGWSYRSNFNALGKYSRRKIVVSSYTHQRLPRKPQKIPRVLGVYREGIPASEASILGSIPNHVAIIMDGNGRWANKRGQSPSAGHLAGVTALEKTVSECIRIGIPYLSVYALSVENKDRDITEVSFLLNLVESVLQDKLDDLLGAGVCLKFVGDKTQLGSTLNAAVDRAERASASNRHLVLSVLLNYSGRQDFLEASKQVALKVKQGEVDIDDIDENMISDNLSLKHIPRACRDPDLLIRTGGEKRISNFLLFEMAYTELHFVDIYWPDFNEYHFQCALQEYSRRERRYGLRQANPT